MRRVEFLILLCLILTTSLQAQVFTVGDRYPTGIRPECIVAADFDGDNDIDLAVGHRKDSSLMIYTNDGSANFTLSQNVSAFFMRELFTADLNGDGLSDLMACEEYGGVNFWYSNGDGTFNVGLSQAFGAWPEALCAADFDDDGIIDVAYNNLFDGSGINIKFGLGDGAFAASTPIVGNIEGFWINAADFDNDGDVDIVFDSAGIDYTILNNGDGTFADRLPALGGVNAHVVAEINGDEYPDLVGLGTYSCAGTPAYVLGTAEATFSPREWAWIVAGWDHTSTPAVADFNGDGHTDIAICCWEYNNIQCGFNNGRVVFDLREYPVFADTGGYEIAAGDFDGDGDPDMAVTCLDDSLTIIFSLAAQHSRRILVPDDFPTVQEAIDYAWNLDTIVVAPGIYVENLDFGGKNIVLITEELAESGRASGEPTILDGGGVDRVLTFDDGEDFRSIVAGFIIQNGNANGLGGGVYCYDTAAPTIINNIIKDNYASTAGGAVFINQGAATIRNNLITGNSSGMWGGAIYISGATGTIASNTVYGNSTEEGGGALYFNYGSPTIRNNIFWGNSSTTNAQEIYYLNDPPVITYSVVQGGWPGEGNIDSDPLFTDPANGDFTLTEGSPCINAGDPDGPLDPDGTVADIGTVVTQQVVDVDDAAHTGLPDAYVIDQNHPNPFNPATEISYSLPTRSQVTVEIFNILGQRIITLIDEVKPAGIHRITWNGVDNNNRPVATGVYLYRLRAGDFVQTKKMMLLK